MPEYCNISTKSVLGCLTIRLLPGIGDAISQKLVRAFDSLEGIQAAAQTKSLSGILRAVPASLNSEKSWDKALVDAEGLLDKANKLGVRILSQFDSEYPKLLKLIKDRPLVLYTKGGLPLGIRNVACVGTRNPTQFGTHQTQQIVEMLVRDQWSIISGLAFGIDAEAHRQAVASNGHTVAVLGNGLDLVYPREHRQLASKILDGGGALISEQPFGVRALAHHLVQRNRLQSGISAGTIVIQTALDGGTMQTVRFTLMQGRKLFAPVPYGDQEHSLESEGTLAITGKTGPELLEMFNNVATDYSELLGNDYLLRPPAYPIKHEQDYLAVRESLSDFCVNIESTKMES
jgi:DNA processing protein